jgi:hypothetical protein
MTRLSLKVGFYLLAPSGMMVYTDPLTASANMPQNRPIAPQQAAVQQPWPSQGNPAQPGMEYQVPVQPYQSSAQPGYQPQAYAQPGPYAPPPRQAAYTQAPQPQRNDVYEDERFAL